MPRAFLEGKPGQQHGRSFRLQFFKREGDALQMDLSCYILSIKAGT